MYGLFGNTCIVCLPEENEALKSDSATAENCYVAGWGRLSSTSWGSPDKLQTVDVDIIDKETCNDLYNDKIHIPSEICAGEAYTI